MTKTAKTHYAPTLTIVGVHLHPAACGAPVDEAYPMVTAHRPFITCARCAAKYDAEHALVEVA